MQSILSSTVGWKVQGLYAQGAKPDEFLAWEAFAMVNDGSNGVLEHEKPDAGGSEVIQSAVVH